MSLKKKDKRIVIPDEEAFEDNQFDDQFHRQASGDFEGNPMDDHRQNRLKPHSKYVHPIEAATAEAYQMDHRFRNLENPLAFIDNEDIGNLRKKYNNLKYTMKEEQDKIAEFSKSIYKKVIARDSEYSFQHQIYGSQFDPSQQFNAKYSKSGQLNTIPDKANKEDLERRFKHGEVTSIEEKRERLREEKEIPLTFRHIKLIDTPEFDQLKDIEFYDLLRSDYEDKSFSHAPKTVRTDSNDKDSVSGQMANMKHGLIDSSQYHAKQSYNFLFNCDRELMFWQVPLNLMQTKNDDDTMATCAFLDTDNVGLFQMLDFAAHNIEIEDIVKFYKLKDALEKKVQADKNNESLEEKYNEARRRFEEMKENRLKSKNQRIPVKYVHNEAQTNNNMEEKNFDQYFVQDAKDIFDRLKQLNDIRDSLIENEDGQNFNVMITNIGLEIGKELFRLLMLVLKGENFSNYSQFLRMNDEQEVERRILEMIHLEFKNFKQFDVNGISKVDIIKKYLEEREKNERFYESYLVKKKQAADLRTKRK